MLTCREIAQSASDYLDCNVSWPRRMQMRLHLAMCRHCKRYVDQLALTIASVQASKPDPVDAATTDRIVAAIRESRAKAPPPT